jgi:hypothetical protein
MKQIRFQLIAQCEKLIAEAMAESGSNCSIYCMAQDATDQFMCTAQNLPTILHYVGKQAAGCDFRYFLNNIAVFPFIIIVRISFCI